MKPIHDKIEEKRIELQAKLDSQKSQLDRNRLGQFSTPAPLAEEILAYAKQLLPPDQKIKFLDPAIGTGSFYSALLKAFPQSRIKEAVGYEIDPHYAKPTKALWKEEPLSIVVGDFAKQKAKKHFNLLICNPPYVRHHHLASDYKALLKQETFLSSNMKLSGLAGLYCYFMGLAHSWLEDGAISGWLIPSEFMDVNYGDVVKNYLLNEVTLLHIHRFNPNEVQFTDALVSSVVVWFRNERPKKNHKVNFSFGGSLKIPEIVKSVSIQTLIDERKWTRFPALEARNQSTEDTIGKYFDIKRGLATGNNNFFILSLEEIKKRQLPLECFRPILSGPRDLKIDEIMSNKDGTPALDKKLYLLNCRLPEEQIKKKHPSLYQYLLEGKKLGINKGYICSHRNPWYAQETRVASPFICTYLGRNRNNNSKPFRFILNHSQGTFTNVYLALYPKPFLTEAIDGSPERLNQVWECLKNIDAQTLLGEGRVYGGGLHKLEPKELANVPVPELAELVADFVKQVNFDSIAAE